MERELDVLELAVRARGGDAEALAELVERLRLSLFALAYAELRHYEDAQDAVAAAILQICRHIRDVRKSSSVRAWMNAIVRNEAHRLRRGNLSAEASLNEADALSSEDPCPLMRLDVERALRKLPQDMSCAIKLFYLAEWPISAIAHHLARPEGTIKRWLHHGRRRLAMELKGYSQMNQQRTACIVAPDLTPLQLKSITDALKSAGWPVVRKATGIRSLDDLYHIEKGQAQQLGPASARPITRLAKPLAGSRCLFLSETIAGRSAFEFLPIARAIDASLPVCLLINLPVSSDSTIYAAWLSGFDLCLTLDAEPSIYEHWFSRLRQALEARESAGDGLETP